MKIISLIAAVCAAAALTAPSFALAQVAFTGSYGQTQITAGETAQLALSAANPTGANLTTGAFNYTFPAGTWNFVNGVNCAGGSLSSNGGSSTVSLTNLVVNAGATCVLNFTLRPANAGVYGLSSSTLTYAGADALSPKPLTAGGNPTLTVLAPIPTMSEWAMILFGAILAGGTALYVQRRRMAA